MIHRMFNIALDCLRYRQPSIIAVLIGAAFFVFVPSAMGQISFATPIVIPTGPGCSAVVAVDVNGDGWMDIATANRGSHDMTILINLGGGEFAPAVSYPAGEFGETTPRSIAAVDVNGDGHPDVITSNENAHTIAVFLNDGTGNFGEPILVPMANRPMGIEAADFNDDGWMDVAVTHRGTSTGPLHILLNRGTEDGQWLGFDAPHVYTVGTDSREVAIGDLNDDQLADVLAVNRGSGTLTVLLGNGDGTFTPNGAIAVGSLPRDATLDDLNGNGLMDIAVGDYGSSFAWILLNQGFDKSGWLGFATPVGFPGGGTAPHAITTTDIQNNGLRDVVMANVQSGGTVSVMINDGNAGFSETYVLSNGSGTNSAGAIAAADFTGDGLVDLVTGNVNSTGDVSFIRNTSTKVEPPESADLNDDGVIDVSDLLLLLEAWGSCPKAEECAADVTGDGVVDVSDLLVLLGAWGPVR